MLKQLPEIEIFNLMELFFSGELRNDSQKVISKEVILPKTEKYFEKIPLLNDDEISGLKNKNISSFLGIHELTNESTTVEIVEMSPLSQKLYETLIEYLKKFIFGEILFDDNSLTFEQSFLSFKKTLRELEQKPNQIVTITYQDVQNNFYAIYPEYKNLNYHIPFWETVLIIWLSNMGEIHWERSFDKKNHRLLFRRIDLMDFTIESVFRSHGLKLKPRPKITYPESRNIWYQSGVLYFATPSGEPIIIDLSLAKTQKMLFDSMWNLWSNSSSENNFYTRKEIFDAYKKVNAIKSGDELLSHIGSEKLGKIKSNITQKFDKKGIRKQIKWTYHKNSNDQDGYIFEIFPLVK